MMGRLIVLVEDEEQVRSLMKTILSAQGAQVCEASDGVEALNVLEELGDKADLLITDIGMPRMDGVSLARAVAARLPWLPVLLVSAYCSDPLDAESFGAAYRFLRKPFRPKQLVEAVEQLVGVRPDS